MGFVVDKVPLGQVFSGYFGFPCKLQIIPPTVLHSLSSIIWGCTIGQILAHVPSGLGITHPYKIKKVTQNINMEIDTCMNEYVEMNEYTKMVISQ
jgi:hypothetical protein